MSVLIFLENWDGKFKKLSYELASYGSKVASMLGCEPIALAIGEIQTDELNTIGHYGISRLIRINGATVAQFDSQLYTALIDQVARKEQASVVILANNNAGKAIAPRLSVRLQAGLGSGVSQLPLSTDPFVVYKKAFSGNAFSKVVIKSPVKILTLAQNSFGVTEDPKNMVIEEIPADAAGVTPKTIVTEVEKQSGKILLTDAEIVVSGGRGMKSPDNWGPLVELAGLMGAATACSRPVSDEGWRPHDEHTGQTGKIIAPNLYIAVGISGATQHLAGVSSSRYIVAVNTDKDAPIFGAAQYGIVGDAAKILPLLVDAFRQLKGK
jgi:electron transfer flavoprotein alpha subunit